MKIFSSFVMIGSLLAANLLFAGDARDDVAAAAKKLGASASYSWSSASSVGGNFRPSSEGKTEKDGFTMVNLSFGGNGSSEVVMKDGRGALKFDGDWMSFADAAKDEGDGSGGDFKPIRFIALRMKVFKTPAMDATNLVAKSVELKLTNGAYEGVLTADGVKEIMTMGRSGAGTTITNATGSVKFWLTDGVLTKYEFKVAGHMETNGKGQDLDRTTTVEIKDIDKTKVEVPDEVKKKIG